MRYLQVMGFVVIILGGMAGAAVGETRSKTDACLVTLYNYPAETPQDVLEKVSVKSLLGLKKNLRASKADENTHSQMGLPLTKTYLKINLFFEIQIHRHTSSPVDDVSVFGGWRVLRRPVHPVFKTRQNTCVTRKTTLQQGDRDDLHDGRLIKAMRAQCLEFFIT